MSKQSVNLLLLYPDAENISPIPPGTDYWIDDERNFMIDDEGSRLIFNPGS